MKVTKRFITNKDVVLKDWQYGLILLTFGLWSSCFTMWLILLPSSKPVISAKPLLGIWIGSMVAFLIIDGLHFNHKKETKK
jgi:hypothetical protein